MNLKSKDAITQNSIFVLIGLATGLILLIPLIAMQFTNEVNWDKIDFIVMGFLLFSMGSLFVLVARRFPRRRRVIIATMFVAAFLYIWAELAVGIFTNLGS
jgi:hypothetical protein